MFDIELYKDRPSLKLPYNVADDPQQAARNFLQENGVDDRFHETVANYIRSRSGDRASAPAAAAVGDESKGAVDSAVLNDFKTSDKFVILTFGTFYPKDVVHFSTPCSFKNSLNSVDFSTV